MKQTTYDVISLMIPEELVCRSFTLAVQAIKIISILTNLVWSIAKIVS